MTTNQIAELDYPCLQRANKFWIKNIRFKKKKSKSLRLLKNLVNNIKFLRIIPMHDFSFCDIICDFSILIVFGLYINHFEPTKTKNNRTNKIKITNCLTNYSPINLSIHNMAHFLTRGFSVGLRAAIIASSKTSLSPIREKLS